MDTETLQGAVEEEQRMSRGFYSIGHFLFQFSQLEFTIRAILTAALELNQKQFDIITAPYDFAMLCTVTCNILIQKEPEKSTFFESFFKACHALNEERKRVAHGTWLDNGHVLSARYVSRHSLKPSYHYQDPAELDRHIRKAVELMEKTLMLGRAIG